MDVLIHHRGLNRTASVPAVAAPAWAADGWEIATDEQAAIFRGVGAEEQLATAQAAEIEVAETAIAEAKATAPPAVAAPPRGDTTAATADAVETATTNKEHKP